MTSLPDSTFRYCNHTLLLRVLALGWIYSADLGEVHGEWSVLVEWPHEGAAPWPA
jgi:hypothetical protein